MLVQPNPTQVRLYGYENRISELEKKLSYIDEKVEYELRKFRKNRYYVKKFGQEAYDAKLAALVAAKNKSLLFKDEQGYWTYSGLAPQISEEFDDKLEVRFQRPEAKRIPWAKKPEHEARYYQTKSIENLLAIGHGGVELATGTGKTRLVLELTKQLALKTIVMTPSVNIAEQIYDLFVSHLGKKYVGKFYGGKKESGKLFVVGVGASFTRIEKNTKAWDDLSKAEVICCDEAHTLPAKTLAAVCFGVGANASYRFFFTGTHLRNDGLDLLLNAITGPIVYRMSVQEGVDQGFLAKPLFRMLWLNSKQGYDSKDANDMTRAHVYYNPQVNAAAADVANRAVGLMGRPTLILVDELEQFGHLAPHLRYEARFAHGGVNASNRDLVPTAHHDSDPKKLVEQFNAGEFPILVGTSCVATGTDFKAVRNIVYLRGGKSEIEVRQSIGRGTRVVPGKEDCIFADFGIENVPMLKRHAEARKKIYRETYPSYSDIKLV